MRSPRSLLALLVAAALVAPSARAQALDDLVVRFAAMTAVTGYEDAMADTLLALLPGARTDRAGNVVWRRGTAAPVRAVICPMDEVGFVVGGVTPEGYLTVRRVGATPMGPLFDQWLEGQRVTVIGRRGAVQGVVGVRSTHLQRGRAAGPDGPFTADDAFVDVGAPDSAAVTALGIRLLDPLARAKRPHRYGPSEDLLAAPFAAQRAACAALVAALRRLPPAGPGSGTAVAIFARRRHFDHDGAAYALAELPSGVAAQGVVVLGGAAAGDSLGGGPVVAPDSVATPAGWRPVTARGRVGTVALADARALAERLAAFLGGAR